MSYASKFNTKYLFNLLSDMGSVCQALLTDLSQRCDSKTAGLAASSLLLDKAVRMHQTEMLSKDGGNKFVLEK